MKRMPIILRYNKYLYNNFSAIGIGAMVVFIAMVLVAGIAASVIIQTSSQLESQAISTGDQTTKEVSTGLAVLSIEGEVLAAASNKIDKLAIMVRGRAGSPDIDLSTTLLELSNGSNKFILNYLQSQYRYAPAISGIFSTDGFTLTADDFSIIELEDVDNSSKAATPVINSGDKVLITVNATTTFGSLGNRVDIWGRVTPENGAPGVISFTTPGAYTDTVIVLQE